MFKRISFTIYFRDLPQPVICSISLRCKRSTISRDTSMSSSIGITGYSGFALSCDHVWSATSWNRAVSVKKTKMKPLCFASSGSYCVSSEEGAARLSACSPLRLFFCCLRPSYISCVATWGQVGEVRQTEWARMRLYIVVWQSLQPRLIKS